MKTINKNNFQLLDKVSSPIDPARNWFFTENPNKQSSDRYRDFVEKAADGFAEFNLKGECIFCNEAAHRLLGCTREEYMKLSSCQRCGSQTTAIQHSLAYDDILREDLSQKIYEMEIKRKDGNIAIHQISVSTVRDEHDHATGFRVISRDVTENRQLLKEQARMTDFVQGAEDGCYELDLGGNLIFCNDAFMKITGYTLQEYSELKFSKRHPTRKSADISAKMFYAVYQTGQHAQGIVYEILRKDGEKRTIETSISLIRDKARTPTGYRGICRDITDKRKIALERTRFKKQLIHSQKLEAVGTLASGIAHDFNNLLMGIQGYTSLLLMGKDIEHADYEKIKAIEQMVKSGADLTRQILGYARGNHSRLIPVNMNELIGKTVDMFGRTRKDLHIHTGLDPDLHLIEANRGQMEQALLNLLVNAWQAMPDGGEIFLESSNVTVDETFAKANAIAAGRCIRVSIQDDGIGMDEWTKNKIFEPFFSTKEAGRGTGLGLTTVNNIIRAHKGTIQVSSRKGYGSTFSIYLPASAKKGPETMKRRAAKSCAVMKPFSLSTMSRSSGK